MRTHRQRMPRCNHCCLPEVICLCAELKPIPTKTRSIFIVHAYEIRKSTNTGRLAHLVMPNSDLCVRGRLGETINFSDYIDPNRANLVLFPDETACELSPEYVASLEKPITLFIPDGNWRQASRIPKREPELKNLQRVKIPLGKPSEYRLRREPKLGFGLATMEAAARALGIIEGPEVEEQLMHIFRRMVEKTLCIKGQLSKDDVYGGFSDAYASSSPEV